MVALIIVFAGLVCVAGLLLFANPADAIRLLAKNADTVRLHILAVAVRLLMGIALVLSADDSRFPASIYILGWLSIVATIVLAAIGRRRFIALMHWATRQAESLGRFAGAITVAFGVFLFYAFI
jgi:hypothetical protein